MTDTSTGRPVPRPSPRSTATREAIMAAAERLYAEEGLSAISNRQIGEAAGQGNVTAVSYHFGSRLDLVRAIMVRHGEEVDALRGRHVAEAAGSSDLRVWVRCLVRPVSEHLAALGVPSWQARFTVQVLTDPVARNLVAEEALTRPGLHAVLLGLGGRLAHLPPHIRRVRGDMARHLITLTCAERERGLADGTAQPCASWSDTADELEDALVGLFTAPVTHHTPGPRKTHEDHR